MVQLHYDGSFEGLLTVVFETYALKLEKAQICRPGAVTASLFGTPFKVRTDTEKAGRVWKKLKELIGADGLHTFRNVYLSELPEMEDVILACARYVIDSASDVLGNYGHPEILKLKQVSRMVHREKHRMEAFVRFQLSTDGLYYAAIDPDFNVLPLIAPHFKQRYADQRWLIYDSKRKYGIHYDLSDVSYVEFVPEDQRGTLLGEAFVAEEEILYRNLWKDYFKSTNIKSRANKKLHLQHMPKRYWKYLVEKQ
jgi:probable DNA metabolism protein